VAAVAGAAWPHYPGENLRVTASAGTADRTGPAIAADNTGGVTVVWRDRAGSSWDLRGMRIAADGRRTGASGGNGVSSYPQDESAPVLVAVGGLNSFVAFNSPAYGAGDIMLHPLVDGVSLVGYDLTFTAGGNQVSPVLAAVPDGGTIVVWQDSRGSSVDVYAQRFVEASGIMWTDNGVPICTAGTDQTALAIAPDGYSGAIITWRDQRNGNADVYAQRVNAAGAVQWTANGVAVGSGTGDQWAPKIIPDAAGGAIIVWHDWRSGNADIYAQRLNSAGVAQWAANGVALCAATTDQANPAIVPDGLGGAIVAWQDSRNLVDADIYAQRVSASGAVQWTANGVALCAATGNQQTPVLVPDATGGAACVWQDQRTGSWDIYAQRVSSAGVPQWTTNGVVVSNAAGDQTIPVAASDGGSGIIVAWQDARGSYSDIFTQHLDEWGLLGAEPSIVKVRDVPNDQGGQVKVSWAASALDTDPASRGIASYTVFRSVPPQKALRTGTTTDPTAAEAKGLVLTTGGPDKTYYWEYVASQNAYHLSNYSYIVPTEGDSLAGKNPRMVVLIQARNSGSTHWWFSQPDSGYSVDNLSPATPAFLASRHAADATRICWRPNTETDLAQYRLYRGTSAGFVPGAGNLVTAQADTGYVDSGASPYSWYKLTAVDAHGNESPVATLLPQQISGLPDGGARAVLRLYPCQPNPFNPRTTIKYDQPASGPVRLSVFDVAGRLVRTLVDDSMPQGSHEAVWDGTDSSGRAVGSGSYLARLEFGGRVETVRMVVVR
jgi:hypothetical protein